MKEPYILILTLIFLLLANFSISAEGNETNDTESSEGIYSITNITGTIEEVISIRLNLSQNYLKEVRSEIGNLSEFYQEQINSILKIEELEQDLEEIEQNYLNSSTKEEYTIVLENLSELDLLVSVYKSREAKDIFLYPSLEKINLDILEEIGEGTYDKDRESEYVDAIILWNQDSIEAKFNFNEITAIRYPDVEEVVLKVFELNIKKFGDIANNSYLILRKMENIQFDKDYSEEEKSNYIYINLKNIDNNIIFSTTEDVNFNELPAFISPEINSLSLIDEPQRFKEEKKWGLFLAIMIALFLFAFILYLFLIKWYKRRYENYLFKDRNNFINILSYIENSKKIGKSDKEIILKLKESGWNSEQIRYAMKKHRKGILPQILASESRSIDKTIEEVNNEEVNEEKISNKNNKEVNNINEKGDISEKKNIFNKKENTFNKEANNIHEKGNISNNTENKFKKV